jgi:hypothetical protein
MNYFSHYINKLVVSSAFYMILILILIFLNVTSTNIYARSLQDEQVCFFLYFFPLNFVIFDLKIK